MVSLYECLGTPIAYRQYVQTGPLCERQVVSGDDKPAKLIYVSYGGGRATGEVEIGQLNSQSR
jgi:hypothetical protein